MDFDLLGLLVRAFSERFGDLLPTNFLPIFNEESLLGVVASLLRRSPGVGYAATAA